MNHFFGPYGVDFRQRNFTPRLGTGDFSSIATYADVSQADFQDATALWDTHMLDYPLLLFAQLRGERDSAFAPRVDGDWIWINSSRRYRNRETGERIASRKYLDLRDDFTDSLYPDVERLATDLAERKITLHQWLRRFAKLIQSAHLAAWMFGGGGFNTVSTSDISVLNRTLREQYSFLTSFAEEIKRNNTNQRQNRIITERGLYRRGIMYIESITASAERARTVTYGFHPDILPNYPADGTTLCLMRCRCHWQFVFLRGQDSFYHAYWRLRGGRPDGRNCETCLQYAQQYDPYTVIRF